MIQNKEKLKTKLSPGKRQTHGGYSFLRTEGLPVKRRHIESYLTAARQGMVNDLAKSEEDLSTGQIILIDRIISMLGVVRCIEEHVRDHTVMKGEELSPSLKSSYLSYNNSIRLNLQVLGIERRLAKGETALDDYVAQIGRESEELKQRVKVQADKVIGIEGFASAQQISKALATGEPQVSTILLELGYEELEEGKFFRRGTLVVD